MRQLGQMKKSTKNSLFTYTLVIAAFVVVQALRMGPGVGAMLEGQLIPICAYIVMALALNLVVGVSGELSLGHAGFMSIGAFAGSALALALQSTVTLSPLRLACLLYTSGGARGPLSGTPGRGGGAAAGPPGGPGPPARLSLGHGGGRHGAGGKYPGLCPRPAGAAGAL